MFGLLTCGLNTFMICQFSYTVEPPCYRHHWDHTKLSLLESCPLFEDCFKACLVLQATPQLVALTCITKTTYIDKQKKTQMSPDREINIYIWHFDLVNQSFPNDPCGTEALVLAIVFGGMALTILHPESQLEKNNSANR